MSKLQDRSRIEAFPFLSDNNAFASIDKGPFCFLARPLSTTDPHWIRCCVIHREHSVHVLGIRTPAAPGPEAFQAGDGFKSSLATLMVVCYTMVSMFLARQHSHPRHHHHHHIGARNRAHA